MPITDTIFPSYTVFVFLSQYLFFYSSHHGINNNHFHCHYQERVLAAAIAIQGMWRRRVARIHMEMFRQNLMDMRDPVSMAKRVAAFSAAVAASVFEELSHDFGADPTPTKRRGRSRYSTPQLESGLPSSSPLTGTRRDGGTQTQTATRTRTITPPPPLLEES